MEDKNISKNSMEQVPIRGQDPKTKKKNVIKYIIYMLFILGATAVVGVTSLWGDDGKQVLSMLKSANIRYLLLFVGFVILNFALQAFIIFLFARLYEKHYKYHQAVANNFVGTFYNGITPGASGGQVAQVYTFSKQGLTASSGASVLVMNYIIYQGVLIAFGIVSVATRIDRVLAIQTIDLTISGSTIPIPISIFIILGFALNLFVTGMIFVMSYSHRLHNFIIVHLINFGAKLHLVKNPDEKRESLMIQVENYRIELRRLQSNIPFTLLIIFLTVITFLINDSYPFLCGLALNGFNEFNSVEEVLSKMFDSMVYTNFHQMITGLIPIPGSSGISEFIFFKLFLNYFDSTTYESNQVAITNAVMLLWRFVTFLFPFFVSGIVSAFYKSKGNQKQGLLTSDKKTFVTIQMETYEERKVSSDTQYETKSLERKEVFDKLNILKNKKKDSENKDIIKEDIGEKKDGKKKE
ncbi:MAG: lysylphosphatidylglycerol synthase transmembrane domain-containing protein [Bacilli bacterium]